MFERDHDHVAFGMEWVGSRIGRARQPIEVAEVSDSGLPHRRQRGIDRGLAEERVGGGRASPLESPALQRAVVDTVRACLPRTSFFERVQGLDRRAQVHWREHRPIKPVLDQLEKLGTHVGVVESRRQLGNLQRGDVGDQIPFEGNKAAGDAMHERP